jgi:hypothetical protein
LTKNGKSGNYSKKSQFDAGGGSVSTKRGVAEGIIWSDSIRD